MSYRFLSACLISAVAFLSAQAKADTYQIDSNHTFPVFEVSHLGFSTQRGRFNKTQGHIKWDTASKKARVELSIDVNSLDMGFSTWNEHLLAETFFNAAKFPKILFQSEEFDFDGQKLSLVKGQLSLLGVKRPIHLVVSDLKCGTHPMTKKEVCGANIKTQIKRSDFGMKAYLPAIGDDIVILSPIEAIKQDNKN